MVKIQFLSMIHLLSLTQIKQILVCFHYIILCSDLKLSHMKNPVPWHLLTDPDFQAQQFFHLILGYKLTEE